MVLDHDIAEIDIGGRDGYMLVDEIRHENVPGVVFFRDAEIVGPGSDFAARRNIAAEQIGGRTCEFGACTERQLLDRIRRFGRLSVQPRFWLGGKVRTKQGIAKEDNASDVFAASHQQARIRHATAYVNLGNIVIIGRAFSLAPSRTLGGAS